RRILDLACGTGTLSVAWAERGGRVVGMDIDRGLLGLAREFAARASPGAAAGPMGAPPGVRASDSKAGTTGAPQGVCGGGCRLPFGDGRFDVVFCNSLLEHVPDWRAVLREIGRVLAPGGI